MQKYLLRHVVSVESTEATLKQVDRKMANCSSAVTKLEFLFQKFLDRVDREHTEQPPPTLPTPTATPTPTPTPTPTKGAATGLRSGKKRRVETEDEPQSSEQVHSDIENAANAAKSELRLLATGANTASKNLSGKHNTFALNLCMTVFFSFRIG